MFGGASWPRIELRITLTTGMKVTRIPAQEILSARIKTPIWDAIWESTLLVNPVVRLKGGAS